MQAIRDDARPGSIDQDDESVTHVRSPGLLPWRHAVLTEIQIRSRSSIVTKFAGGSGTPPTSVSERREQARTIQSPHPSVVAEVRDQKRAVGRDRDPVRTQVHRRSRAPGLRLAVGMNHGHAARPFGHEDVAGGCGERRIPAGSGPSHGLRVR